MIDLEYTITKFDKDINTVVVAFADGAWAEIRLSNPLPKDITELENIIKQFAPSKEAIESRTNPDADLSYIDQFISVPRSCPRLSLVPELLPEAPEIEVDPEIDIQLQAAEKIVFENRVKELLVALNVIPAQA